MVTVALVQRPRGRVAGGWRLAALGLLWLGAGLRLWDLARKPFWVDEAFSVWIAGQPVGALLTWVGAIDLHPPLYYLLLAAWQTVGTDEFVVRWLSAALGLLSLALAASLVGRLAGPPVALATLLLCATAPHLVRHSQEARMYALSVAVALMVLNLWARAVASPQNRLLWAAHSLALAGAFLTHHVLLSLAGAEALVLLRWGRAVRRPALVSLAGALVLWSPWAPAFFHQLRVVSADFWLESPQAARAPTAVLAFLVGEALPAVLPAALSLALAAALGVLALWGARRLGRWGLWLGLVVGLPVGVELAVSLVRPLLLLRTLVFTLPVVLMGLSAGLLARPGRRLRGLVLGGLLAAQTAGLLQYYQTQPPEGWPEVAAFIAANWQAGDLLLFNAAWTQIPFDYYFRRTGLDADRRGLPVDIFAAGLREPKVTPADLERLDGLLQGRRRVWLVLSHDWYTDPGRLSQAALATRGQPVLTRTTAGVEVVLYRLWGPDQHPGGGGASARLQ